MGCNSPYATSTQVATSSSTRRRQSQHDVRPRGRKADLALDMLYQIQEERGYGTPKRRLKSFASLESLSPSSLLSSIRPHDESLQLLRMTTSRGQQHLSASASSLTSASTSAGMFMIAALRAPKACSNLFLLVIEVSRHHSH